MSKNKSEELFGDYRSKDILGQILFRYGIFPPRENLSTHSLVSKLWNNIVEQSCFWKERGADSKQDFIERVSLMDDRLKKLVLDGFYTVRFAEEIKSLWSLNEYERFYLLIVIVLLRDNLNGIREDGLNIKLIKYARDIYSSFMYIGNIEDEETRIFEANRLLSEVPFLDKMIGFETPEEILIEAYGDLICIWDQNYINILKTNEGIQAIYEGLLKIEAIPSFSPYELEQFLNEDNLQELRENNSNPICGMYL